MFTNFHSFWRNFFSSWHARFAILLLGSIFLFAILGPCFSNHSPLDIQFEEKNTPPGKKFWFGTDELGRDVFIKTALGAQISLSIACLATLINGILGIFWASLSMYEVKKIDFFLLRFFDVVQSIPYLLFAMFLTFILTPGFQTVLFAMTLTGWIPIARIIRSQLIYLQKEEFVLAARSIGASSSRILFRHLLPNAASSIVASILLNTPAALFTEAFLSFLGLGIQAPYASLGVLLNDGVSSISYYPWRFFFPAIFLSATIFSFYLLSHAVQKALDPRISS